MNKTIILLTATACTGLVAQAQLQSVAAWDFASVSVGGGAGTLDTNENFVPDETADYVNADYSGSGLFSWSGATNDTSGFTPSANLSSNTADIVADNFGLTSLGGGLGWVTGGVEAAGQTLTFSNLDLTGLSGATLDFASQIVNFDGSASVNLGGDLSGSISLDSTDAAYNFDASALDGLSNAEFTMTFSDISGIENFRLDNIQLTAVPEPSAFAAIFGAVALGFVAVRRRRA